MGVFHTGGHGEPTGQACIPSFLYRVPIVILTISQLRSMIACLHMTCESRLGFLDALGRFQQPETGWKFVYRVAR
jgi:hypothetical protein